MGTQRIPSRINGQVIDESWFNAITRALLDYLVPRNSDGAATDLSGSLGTPLLRWLKAFVSEGYWSVGDFKLHHSYNGAIGPGEGWMLCDGRTINESNYDTEHGAGAWDTFVGSSVLDGKKLPDFSGRYIVGKATTTQDGSGDISATGVAGSTIDTRHVHNIYNYGGLNASDTTFDSAGGTLTCTAEAAKSSAGLTFLYSPTSTQASGASQTMYTDSGGDAAKDFRPDSIEVQVYMRII